MRLVSFEEGLDRPHFRVRQHVTGVFYAPLRCSGRIYPRGQEIPFRITVRITATNGAAASAISATYVNRERTNLTPCIGGLGHDSAR